MAGSQAQPPLSLSFPDDWNIGITVPIAAILLDYEIAYVPSASDSHTFLSGVPVTTYECLLASDNNHSVQPLSVMKFSCPTALETTYPGTLSPEGIMGRVKAKLDRRFVDIGEPSLVSTVICETVVHERLAL